MSKHGLDLFDIGARLDRQRAVRVPEAVEYNFSAERLFGNSGRLVVAPEQPVDVKTNLKYRRIIFLSGSSSRKFLASDSGIG